MHGTMNEAVSEAEVARAGSRTGTVEVRTNGGTGTVQFTEGMTVSDAVSAAGLRTGFLSRTFVNDKDANRSDLLNPGDVVVIAPRIRNG